MQKYNTIKQDALSILKKHNTIYFDFGGGGVTVGHSTVYGSWGEVSGDEYSPFYGLCLTYTG